jgi:uncharacterized protein YdhG (YjbR/CyaY superfamily)
MTSSCNSSTFNALIWKHCIANPEPQRRFEASGELKWNLPVYVRGGKTNLWMLQNFKRHCSLRFSPEFFASQKAAVEAAGFESGSGFIELPYEEERPTKLLKALMKPRVLDYMATEACRRIDP